MWLLRIMTERFVFVGNFAIQGQFASNASEICLSLWDFDDLRAGGGGLWDQKATVLILPVITHDSAINDNTWEVSQLPKLASEVLLCVCVCMQGLD